MALTARRRPTPTIQTLLARQLRSALVWYPKAQRYRDTATGRFIGPERVRAIIDSEIDKSEARLLRHGRRFAEGSIDINDWRALCADEIKLLHLANYAAAKGGFAKMTKRDYANVEATLRRQYRYLERFARQIDDGRVTVERNGAVSKGFLNRLGMYAQAARESYERARRQSHVDQGYAYERNVLHSAEACHSDGGLKGCSELTAQGWQAIGSLPMVGRRRCRARCKCTISYARELS